MELPNPLKTPFHKELLQHFKKTGHQRFKIFGLKKGKVRVLHCVDCEEVNK